MHENSENSLHGFLRTIFRRRWLFLLASSLFMIVALLAFMVVALGYSGEAIFEFGLEVAAEQISRTSRDSFATIKERLQYDLAGYKAVESAAIEVGLDKGLPHDKSGQLTNDGRLAMQVLVKKLMADVDVKWKSRSGQEELVVVRFNHADPLMAKQVPNVLVAGYINRTYRRIREGLERQHKFLSRKVADCNKLFDGLAMKRIKFETDHAGVLPDNPTALYEKIQRARTETEALRRRQSQCRRKLARLSGAAGVLPKSPTTQQALQVVKQPNPELARLRGQLLDLRDQLDTALTIQHMTEQHPTVQGMRTKIAQVAKRIEQTPPVVVKELVFGDGHMRNDLTMLLAGTQGELEAVNEDMTCLQGILAGYEDSWASFVPVRHDYLRLVKDYENSKTEAEQWQQRLGKIDVALSAAVNNRLTRLKAVQPAQYPFLPSSPSLLVVLGLAIGGGLIFGGGLVFLANLLDRSITTPAEASEYFNVPVQGVIAEIVTPGRRAIRTVARWILVPLVSAVLLAGLSASMLGAVLRLQSPRRYQELMSSPVDFVYREFCEPAARAMEWD